MIAPTLETDRLIIRAFRNTDAELWQSWDVDPEVQVYMPEPVNLPQDITQQYQYIRECEAEQDGYYWSVETKDGVTVGTISLTDINSYHMTAEIGIVIGNKEYWGKGIATEAMDAVVNYAFSNLDIERISAETEAENLGVSKVLLKCGFVHDGTFESARVKNGQRITVRHYGAIKSSWTKTVL